MIEKYSSPEETLTEIRHLMERSSRFISLSGFSGIFAGIYALIGAAAAYYILRSAATAQAGYPSQSGIHDSEIITLLLFDAALVLVLAVGTGILLTTRRAKKDGNSLFDAAAKKLLINLAIPLVTGGIFCLALVYHDNTLYLAPSMLIFYGLALVHASKYTRDDVRSLGMAEIALGLLSLFIAGYQLLFWALGFGVLHIIYGAYMYFKYEK
jgi:predicted lysophospholipase L1 biosynthesis ABC-type transport system permease subunit